MDRTCVMESENIDSRVTLGSSPELINFERHLHDQRELIYVTRGSGRYVVEGESPSRKSGTLFFFRPKEYHYAEATPQTPYECYVSLHRARAGVCGEPPTGKGVCPLTDEEGGKA